MHKLLFAGIFLFTSILIGKSQVTGFWKTVDDRTGSEKSVIEIFEQDDMLHGRIVRLLSGATYTTCEKCSGELKDKPLVGMTILFDLKENQSGRIDGKVLDPNNGKLYSCYLEMERPDVLKLRGYIGVTGLGRTQYWYRVD